MTVKELIKSLEKVHNQDANVMCLDSDGDILKDDGCDIDKIVEVNCDADDNISNVYLVTY